MNKSIRASRKNICLERDQIKREIYNKSGCNNPLSICLRMKISPRLSKNKLVFQALTRICFHDFVPVCCLIS